MRPGISRVGAELDALSSLVDEAVECLAVYGNKALVLNEAARFTVERRK